MYDVVLRSNAPMVVVSRWWVGLPDPNKILIRFIQSHQKNDKTSLDYRYCTWLQQSVPVLSILHSSTKVKGFVSIHNDRNSLEWCDFVVQWLERLVYTEKVASSTLAGVIELLQYM